MTGLKKWFQRAGVAARPANRWALLALLGVAAVAEAGPPLQPLPAPLYSFRVRSPSVSNGTVSADAVLEFALPDPLVVVTGAELGLGLNGDELNALSTSNAATPSDAPFALLFSVDENTIGVAPPDPVLVGAGVPFNATDQAARGQQAGDQFMSTALVSLATGPLDPAGIANNVLVRNNFDEGGVDFVAQPPTSAIDVVAAQLQDRVDAMVNVTTPLPNTVLYYSATHAATLVFGSGGGMPPANDGPSPADVLVCPVPGLPPAVFASFTDLGLKFDDDVDALLVFDRNEDSVFNGTDVILFSLAKGSPSLTTIAGASAVGAAADIFIVEPGQMPSLFVSAATLGLGHVQDNIDAIELLTCTDAVTCANLHGIRNLAGGGGNGNSNGGSGGGDSTCPDGTVEMSALLSGDGVAQGVAEYKDAPDRHKFEVEVWDFVPGTYTVTLNGVVVGVIEVDALGLGELDYDSNDGTFPADFPDATVGDVVSVDAVVTGVFALDCD
ncbi:MAG: hypothetical protein ACE5E6_04745 [Phycisphaerae bacterium]